MTHTLKIEKKYSSWLWLPKIKFWWDKLIKRPTLNEFSCILIISESKSRYVWKSREALYSLRHREDGRNDRLERNGVFFYKRNKLEINQEGM